jgi:hypothetical protein
LLKGLCYTFSARRFVPFDDARFTDNKIRDTPIDHQTTSDTFSSPLFMLENQNPRMINENEERREATGTR